MNAAAVLEEIVSRAHRAADAYSLPFTVHRPTLLRGMMWPLLLAGPCFALGVVPLVNGVVGPFIIFGLMGSFFPVGGLKVHSKQLSEVSVSEAGLAVVTAAGKVEVVRWSEISDLRLTLSHKQPISPVLFVEGKGGSSLAIEVSWVDPIRLFGLVRKNCRRFDGFVVSESGQ